MRAIVVRPRQIWHTRLKWCNLVDLFVVYNCMRASVARPRIIWQITLEMVQFGRFIIHNLLCLALKKEGADPWTPWIRLRYQCPLYDMEKLPIPPKAVGKVTHDPLPVPPTPIHIHNERSLNSILKWFKWILPKYVFTSVTSPFLG
jgi:hypothetical protein